MNLSRTVVGCVVAGQLACAGAPSEPQARAVPDSVTERQVAATCPTQKIAFSQRAGCANDGAVEFCLPTGDAALVAQVKAIAPGLQAGQSRGRAGCDPATETLFLYPTDGSNPAVCVTHHGAMTDAAWSDLCALAAVPEVRTIVPTWYE